jgi:hypothetical protein
MMGACNCSGKEIAFAKNSGLDVAAVVVEELRGIDEEEKRGKYKINMQAKRPIPSPEHVVSSSYNKISGKLLI